jgi:hypothetical protein
MITPLFIFTVFMLTLGPIKDGAGFLRDDPKSGAGLCAGARTAGNDGGDCRLYCYCPGDDGSRRIVAGLSRRLADRRRYPVVSASREMIGQLGRPASPPHSATPPQRPAITPLAIPIIVTPWGVAAILFFADLAYDDLKMSAIVVGILLLVMLLNLIGMLLARQIIAWVGMISFQVLGWILAVLQAAFAVDAVVASARNLAPFHLIP